MRADLNIATNPARCAHTGGRNHLCQYLTDQSRQGLPVVLARCQPSVTRMFRAALRDVASFKILRVLHAPKGASESASCLASGRLTG